MDINITGEVLEFKPTSDMDYFWIGVISTKNRSNVLWVDGKVSTMIITKDNLVEGLSNGDT